MTTEARNPKTGDVTPVARLHRGVLWCPLCDTSQQVGLYESCQTCGAVWLDGEAPASVEMGSVANDDAEVSLPTPVEDASLEDIVDLDEDDPTPTEPSEVPRQRRPNRHGGKLSV